ncbi:hypothetical protein HDU76_004956 [Blyttiomyces sp. JEL0837]|nr:hypothetical protein HDU76_004956 [Blyttiomyces sp. JEL0837]
MSDPSFWQKLIQFHSQESSKGNERFNGQFATFMRCVATQFQDLFVETAIRPAVQSLAADVADKSKQRSAAELLAGLIRGSKHWPLSKLETLWSWVLPVLASAFVNATPESIGYWVECITYFSANRDPRRVFPIVQHIMSFKVDPSAASYYSESKKLYLIKVLLGQFKWRLRPWLPDLFNELMQHVRNPYQQVRESIGGLLDDILQLWWYPSARSVTMAIGWSVASHGGLIQSVDGVSLPGVIPLEPLAVFKPSVDEFFKGMDEWRKIKRDSNFGASDYGNAAKTLIAWVFTAMIRPSNTGTFCHLDEMIREVFLMTKFEDADLQRTSNSMLSVLAGTPYPVCLVPKIVDLVLPMLNPEANVTSEFTWHVKVKALPVLQIFFFNNLFSLSKEVKLHVLKVVSKLLEDPQIEVRNLAAVTLSGFIRCSEREAITSLKADFEKTLRATKLAKKKSTLPPRPNESPKLEGSSSPPASTTASHPMLVKRHGAVLGLSSLVMAFPYEVPIWMPEVLILLSTCVSDLAPISVTVNKTFADFRRTHQDNWQADMEQFTEDQRATLSDFLISASYYA